MRKFEISGITYYQCRSNLSLQMTRLHPDPLSATAEMNWLDRKWRDITEFWEFGVELTGPEIYRRVKRFHRQLAQDAGYGMVVYTPLNREIGQDFLTYYAMNKNNTINALVETIDSLENRPIWTGDVNSEDELIDRLGILEQDFLRNIVEGYR